ncbi:hypothetical protein LOAG_13065 [Loa loa]|uniref:Protein YIF1 n=1 Tax=Loa loa TaxID=7209 RepID=A0A1S0TK64_LOALO|nr:hypothetical protein LOAG_13065 [Loa loa]EFO15444.2 hypothetical protein LOAG_13065 [Loa loa]
MSDPMLNAARQIGGQFAVHQKEKVTVFITADIHNECSQQCWLTKYLSAFHFKYYFTVDNAYFGKKLALILFSFLHRDWTIKYGSLDSPLPP